MGQVSGVRWQQFLAGNGTRKEQAVGTVEPGRRLKNQQVSEHSKHSQRLKR